MLKFPSSGHNESTILAGRTMEKILYDVRYIFMACGCKSSEMLSRIDGGSELSNSKIRQILEEWNKMKDVKKFAISEVRKQRASTKSRVIRGSEIRRDAEDKFKIRLPASAFEKWPSNIIHTKNASFRSNKVQDGKRKCHRFRASRSRRTE